MIKKALRKLAYWMTASIDSRKLARGVFFFIETFSVNRPAKESLVFLLELERYLFVLTGGESCRYGHGIHTKHNHTRYHDFFVERIHPGDKVLDIGCGNGALSFDMALSGATITGIDLNANYIKFGKDRFSHPNLVLIHGDALRDLPVREFEVVVMSNVLEHIEDRINFLTKIRESIKPERWLLRVPFYERDWRVPLMEEIGLDYRLDDTHFIEYTREQFLEELDQAGLTVRYLDTRWGEMWCEASTKPEKKTTGLLND
jgi:SAM-dependent methyltransferase